MSIVNLTPAPILRPVFALIVVIAALTLGGASDEQYATNRVYCASPDGSAEASGGCWEDPLDLQTALTIAEPGSEVRIRQGTYTPGDDEHAAFYLPEGVEVIGGFTGSTINPDERVENPALTVFDGNDERYTVLIAAGVSDATLRNVTVRNGSATLIADEATDLQRRGGGVYVSNANILLSNVIIANNRARFGGAGIYVDEASSIVIRNTTFQGNQTTHPQSGRGGGLRIREGTAELFDVTFRFNRAIRGGGILIDNGDVLIERALFAENEAADRGGGISLYSGDLSLGDSRFSGNVAIREGAGLYVSRAGGRTEVRDTVFHSNSSGDGGAGAWIQSREAHLDHVEFTENNAGLGPGGGLYLGNSDTIIVDARIQGNHASRGGGIAIENTDATFINVLLTGNLASAPETHIDLDAGRPPPDDPHRENLISDPWRGIITGEAFSSDYLRDSPGEDASHAGGGLFAFGSGSITLINSTIAGNGSAGNGAALYRAGEISVSILNSIVSRNVGFRSAGAGALEEQIHTREEPDSALRLRVEDSLLKSECPARLGVFCRGVLTDDPRFVDAPSTIDLPTTSGDFSLWFTSPAIDAGNIEHFPTGRTRDLDGNERFVRKRFDHDAAGANRLIDFGPLEAQIPPHVPDFAVAFTHSSEDAQADINLSTDDTGVISGSVTVETPELSIVDARLGRAYENDGLITIDGEAVLSSGALVGFRIDLEISSATGTIRAFRVRLDTGAKISWRTPDAPIVRDP